MLAVTAAQMRKIEELSINDYGVPGIVLMENAAIRVAEEVISVMAKNAGSVLARLKTVLFAGQGNNGGDAFAVARHICNKGFEAKVFIIGDSSEISGDASTNLEIIKKMGLDITEYGPIKAVSPLIPGAAGGMGNSYTPDGMATGPVGFIERVDAAIDAADIILDGIFGTGFKGLITGVAANVVNRINASGKMVISIDMPSGLNADTGKVEGPCVSAMKTVTFGLPKIGLVVHPGCEYAGQLVVADISIPSGVVDQLRGDIKSHVVDAEMVKSFFKVRPKNTNKGDYGKVLLFTGSSGMTGAGCLSSEAILRVGAGLAYAAVPASLAPIYNNALKELITISLDDSEDPGFIPEDAYLCLPELLKGKSVAAAGPGLSSKPAVRDLTEALIRESKIPLVLDADALNVLEGRVSIFKKLKTAAVLTPHPGEMARLTGKSISEVQEDRIGTALSFAERYGVILVLKGAGTIIASPDGSFFINTTGNPGMATGGSGDVLTGMIAGLAAQGFKPLDAAVAGVYLHGLAGDLASMEKGEYGMIAGDMLDYLPYSMIQFLPEAIIETMDATERK